MESAPEVERLGLPAFGAGGTLFWTRTRCARFTHKAARRRGRAKEQVTMTLCLPSSQTTLSAETLREWPQPPVADPAPDMGQLLDRLCQQDESLTYADVMQQLPFVRFARPFNARQLHSFLSSCEDVDQSRLSDALVRRLIAFGIPPQPRSCRKLLLLHARCGEFSRIAPLLQELASAHVELDEFTIPRVAKELQQACYRAHFEATAGQARDAADTEAIHASLVAAADTLRAALPLVRCRPSAERSGLCASLGALAQLHAALGDVEATQQLLRELKAALSGRSLDLSVRSAVVRMYAAFGDDHTAELACSGGSEKAGNPSTESSTVLSTLFSSALQGYCDAGNADSAGRLVHALLRVAESRFRKERDRSTATSGAPSPPTPLASAECYSAITRLYVYLLRDRAEALRTFRMLKSLGFRPNLEAYAGLAEGMLWLGEHSLALDVTEEARVEGLQLNARMARVVLAICARRADIVTAHACVRRMRRYDVSAEDVDAYAWLLLTAGRAGELATAEALWRQMCDASLGTQSKRDRTLAQAAIDSVQWAYETKGNKSMTALWVARAQGYRLVNNNAVSPSIKKLSTSRCANTHV